MKNANPVFFIGKIKKKSFITHLLKFCMIFILLICYKTGFGILFNFLFIFIFGDVLNEMPRK